MDKPIINPLTLSEVQREAIRAEWEAAKKPEWYWKPYLRGRFRMLQDLFGRDFFEKGE
jgi:hypothetical protein